MAWLLSEPRGAVHWWVLGFLAVVETAILIGWIRDAPARPVAAMAIVPLLPALGVLGWALAFPPSPRHGDPLLLGMVNPRSDQYGVEVLLLVAGLIAAITLVRRPRPPAPLAVHHLAATLLVATCIAGVPAIGSAVSAALPTAQPAPAIDHPVDHHPNPDSLRVRPGGPRTLSAITGPHKTSAGAVGKTILTVGAAPDNRYGVIAGDRDTDPERWHYLLRKGAVARPSQIAAGSDVEQDGDVASREHGSDAGGVESEPINWATHLVARTVSLEVVPLVTAFGTDYEPGTCVHGYQDALGAHADSVNCQDPQANYVVLNNIAGGDAHSCDGTPGLAATFWEYYQGSYGSGNVYMLCLGSK